MIKHESCLRENMYIYICVHKCIHTSEIVCNRIRQVTILLSGLNTVKHCHYNIWLYMFRPVIVAVVYHLSVIATSRTNQSVSWIITQTTCVKIELEELNAFYSKLLVMTIELALCLSSRKDIEGRRARFTSYIKRTMYVKLQHCCNV